MVKLLEMEERIRQLRPQRKEWNEERIRIFQPFKKAGENGIIPAFLQKEQSKVMTYLIKVFSLSLE